MQFSAQSSQAILKELSLSITARKVNFEFLKETFSETIRYLGLKNCYALRRLYFITERHQIMINEHTLMRQKM